MFGPNLIYAVVRLGLGYAIASSLGENCRAAQASLRDIAQ